MEKKAQEEMVGFVLIMLVVAVVFLVFLGIYLRQDVKPSGTDSESVSLFLNALLEYTTDCEINGNKIKVKEVVKECHKQSFCNSETACFFLNKTLTEITESSWIFSSDSPQKGYTYHIQQKSGETTNNIPVVNGIYTPISNRVTSSSSVRGANRSISGGMTISLELHLN